MDVILKIEEIGTTDDYVYDVENIYKNYVCGTSKTVVRQSDSGYNEFAAKADVKYGDSVTPDTSIMIRNHGEISFIMIKNISKQNWIEYNNFKPNEEGRTCKEQTTTESEVWDGEKWSKIRKVIRHKVNKKIYKVFTHTGYVEVTEDHSLINKNKDYITPKDLKVGSELFHGYPVDKIDDPLYYKQILSHKPATSEEKHAFKMGLLHTNGEHRPIPQEILNDKTIYKSFLSGYCIENCAANKTGIRLWAFGQETTSGLFYMMRHLNLKVSVTSDRPNVFQLTSSNAEEYNLPSGSVVLIEETDLKPEYVYDLETESGRFQAGIGTMVVKNTDSIYTIFEFPNQSNIEKETLLDMNWDTAFECCTRISSTFKNPIDLEMEKIMCPLYLYGKKRYSCKIFERAKDKNGKNYFKTFNDFKGIQIVRRDNCNLVKTISKPVFECLLDHNDIPGAIQVVKDYVEKLLTGQLDIKEFIISKSIKSNYKTENKVGRKMDLPGHVLLQQKMIDRKVMNPPQIGDRIPYAYVELEQRYTMLDLRYEGVRIEISEKEYKQADAAVKAKKTNMALVKGSDRMEDPNYVIENPNKCKIDFMFYLEKQITSPMYTIFEVLVKNEEGTMFPRKLKTDKKTEKTTSEISKECKQAINKLLFVDLVKKYNPEPNFMVKAVKVKKEPVAKKVRAKKTTQKNTLDYLMRPPESK